MRISSRIKIGLGMSLLVAALSAVSLGLCPRSDYTHRFRTHFPARAQPRPLNQAASISKYDERYLQAPTETLSNDEGELAWQTSYRMAGLNEMYRLTGQTKYLQLNMLWAAQVMRARDDRRGLKRWTGESGPVWSSEGFDSQGRAAHLVHTAMITYPILEMLMLGTVSTPQESNLLRETLRSLEAHDAQWRPGPGLDEGHYVYAREQNPERAGEPLPVNRANAMAKSLWLAWKLSGRTEYRDKALAIARFFKNRLQKTESGAYTWPYELPLVPDDTHRAAEDSSHGALTASLAPLLAADGQIFAELDLRRFAATVVQGVAMSDSGVISGDVEGSEKADPSWVDLPARWLEFAPYDPAIYHRMVEYYTRYDSDTSPGSSSLAMALLLRYKPSSPKSSQK